MKANTKNTLKWALTGILLLGLLASVITLFVKLDRQTNTTVIGGEAYSIGVLDDSGEVTDGDTAIYLRTPVTTDGLKVTVAKDAKVTYKLYFYDVDGKFVSATTAQSADYNGTIPTTAETVRVVITPTEDKDGKVSVFEVLGYAEQITVTVNK